MRKAVIGAVIAMLATAACSSSATRSRGSSEVLRLGVFPNLTHAPGLVGIAKGIFEEALSPTKLEVHPFNSGTDASNALVSGSIDATYIGPVPAATLFEQGAEVSVVSGAVHNGASLVVRTAAGISGPQDLHGKTIAVPGLGNTQDIALRTWMQQNGLQAKEEGGDVSVHEIDNTQLVGVFGQKQVDAAWEPEPWPTVLEEKGLATELVDERAQWPGGQFPTTELVVSNSYMDAHPDIVRKLVQANVDAIQFIQENAAQAKQLSNSELQDLGGGTLDAGALDQAWSRLTFSYDPLKKEMEQYALNAYSLGIFDTKPDNLSGIFSLGTLNSVLRQKGQSPVGAN